MENYHILWLALISMSVMVIVSFRSRMVDSADEGTFVKNMYFNWGAHHSSFLSNGRDAKLVLDQHSGSGIESKRSFLFGSIEMFIKLPAGNSAGTVTAFYLCSGGEKHDEIDFEFLGNKTGDPYTIHTNMFTKGGGGREQQFQPWFDPTADYHNYTIHWSPSQIVWYVDSVPIRIYRNYESEGIPYPNQQWMKVYSSIWNADSWATQGGLVKIDWTNSPFVANLRNFSTRSCCQYDIHSPTALYTTQVTLSQKRRMNWIRNKYMVYDYCKDSKRFHAGFPGECFRSHY